MTRRPHSRRSIPVRVEDRRLEAEALNLRLTGLGYRQIAEHQGCSVSVAHDRVTRALEGMVPADEADALRKIENERLNAALSACIDIIGGKQTVTIDGRRVELPYAADERLAAIGRLTKISERIAKLNGLDVPVTQKAELEVTTVDYTDAQLRKLARELAAGAASEAQPVPD